MLSGARQLVSSLVESRTAHCSDDHLHPTEYPWSHSKPWQSCVARLVDRVALSSRPVRRPHRRAPLLRGGHPLSRAPPCPPPPGGPPGPPLPITPRRVADHLDLVNRLCALLAPALAPQVRPRRHPPWCGRLPPCVAKPHPTASPPPEVHRTAPIAFARSTAARFRGALAPPSGVGVVVGTPSSV